MASYNYTFVSGDTVTPTKLNSARTVSEIVDADVSATAAIAMSKLATGALPTAITVATANIVDANVTTGKVADAAITAPKLSGAQTGSAPIYGCRAWVNFNGNARTDLNGTYSQSGTTVTVTATAHDHIVGHRIRADITSGTAVDGSYIVATVPSANTFTYTAGTSLTTSGNITLVRQTIRASGNVQSVIGVESQAGSYSVNYSTAMPNANYAALATANPIVTSGNGSIVMTNDRTEHYTNISIYNSSSQAVGNAEIVSVAIFG
jgi:hypothetical protein